MSEAYKEGDTYSARVRRQGHDVYVSGFRTKRQASIAAVSRLADLLREGRPRGHGPTHTTLAQALQNYGLERLRFMKGAQQDVRRINKYLRAARLDLLVARPVSEDEKTGARFDVTLEPFSDERIVPKGLHQHRKNLLTQSAGSDKRRAVLATKNLADVTRFEMQEFVDALLAEGSAPASIGLERALLRALFNHAKYTWNWSSLTDNPATKLKMPAIDNKRIRVLSAQEQTRLDAALQDCRNSMVAPVYTLLRESAMRASEPLEGARWGDVDWERSILRLKETKTGEREVPLSPVALQALHDLQPGKPRERIVRITYEAMRAAFKRACERAGISGLHLHDLRRTAATRMALKTGNMFLVKALTGHKTDKMVGRYVNVNADDVVNVMHASDNEAKVPEKTKREEDKPEVTITVAGQVLTLSSGQAQALFAHANAVAGMTQLNPSASPVSVPEARPADGTHATQKRTDNVIPLRRVS